MKQLSKNELKRSINIYLNNKNCQREFLENKLQLLCNDQQKITEVLNELEHNHITISSQKKILFQYIKKGYGPLRITHNLSKKGISKQIIDKWLTSSEIDWLILAKQILKKKFGKYEPQNCHDKKRYINFLLYRGFSIESLRSWFD